MYVPWLMLFSISGNSKPGQHGSEWQTVLNRHGLERICKPRTAVTAHPVGLALQREDTTKARVVTSKEEIKDNYEDCHNSPLRLLRLLIARFLASVERRRFRQMNKVNEQVRLLDRELNPTLTLQAINLFRPVSKPLVPGAIPAFCPRPVLTFQGHCRNAGTDLRLNLRPCSCNSVVCRVMPLAS